MRSRERILAGGIALAVLAAAALWLRGVLATFPLARYGFEWLVKLTPGECWFYGTYLLAGGVAGALLGWALAPLATRSWGRLRSAFGRDPLRWLVGLSLLAGALSAGVGFGVLRDQNVTDDEDVYVFQSRLLLEGRASRPAPEMPEFLANAFVDTRDGRWFGQYPPGHPLALAPAVHLGIPRLAPVFLCAVNTLLTGLLVGRILGTAWAPLGAVFLLGSPLFLLTGSTLLSHSTAYFGLVLAALGAAEVARTGRAWPGLVSGAGLAMLFLTRPWTGVTLGLFPAAWLWWSAQRRGSRRALALASVPIVAGAVGFLLYNRGQSGEWMLTGYEAQRRAGGMIEFGFGTIIPGLHVHTPILGLANALRLALRFAAWSGPGLLVAGVALGGLRDRAWRRLPGAGVDLAPAQLVTAAGGMLLLGCASYVPYWSIGVNDTGPVKTYEWLLPYVLLASLGARRWAERHGPGAPVAWGIAGVLVSGVLFWPAELGHLSRVSAQVRAPYAAVERAVRTPALVFTPSPSPQEAGSWVFGRPNPRPDLSDPILYVRDLGPADAAYARLHPERASYRLVRFGRTWRVERLSGQ